MHGLGGDAWRPLAASCLTLEDVLGFVQLMGVTIP